MGPSCIELLSTDLVKEEQNLGNRLIF